MIASQPLVLTNVEAQCCKQCGYMIVDSNVRHNIEAVLRGLPSDAVVVPIYDARAPLAGHVLNTSMPMPSRVVYSPASTAVVTSYVGTGAA